MHGEGKKVGTYNGSYPFQGQMTIDVPAAAVTANAWITWKYDLDFYFYWYTDNWAAKGSVLDSPKPATNTSAHVFPIDDIGTIGSEKPKLTLSKQHAAGPMDYALAAAGDGFAVAAVTRDTLVPGGAFSVARFGNGAYATLDGTTLQDPGRDHFPDSTPSIATSPDGGMILLVFVDGNDAFPTSITVLRANCSPHESP